MLWWLVEVFPGIVAGISLGVVLYSSYHSEQREELVSRAERAESLVDINLLRRARRAEESNALVLRYRGVSREDLTRYSRERNM